MFWVTRFKKMTSPDSKRWLHNTVNIFKVTNFKRVNLGNYSGSPGVRTSTAGGPGFDPWPGK